MVKPKVEPVILGVDGFQIDAKKQQRKTSKF